MILRRMAVVLCRNWMLVSPELRQYSGCQTVHGVRRPSSLTRRPLGTCSDDHNVALARFPVRARPDAGAAVLAATGVGQIVDLTVALVRLHVYQEYLAVEGAAQECISSHGTHLAGADDGNPSSHVDVPKRCLSLTRPVPLLQLRAISTYCTNELWRRCVGGTSVA